jgi:uncharacterized damage-inducible protein DinB
MEIEQNPTEPTSTEPTSSDAAFREAAFGDVERELAVTRRVLEAIPEAQLEWRPHPKSMSLGSLAIHVAFLPDWARGALASDVLDFSAAPQPPKSVKNRQELLEHFDRNCDALRAAIAAFDSRDFQANWTMRNGEQVFVTKPRPLVYRAWSMNHLVHHRGQLALYLRLLGVPVPTIYFNTADNPDWVFD